MKYTRKEIIKNASLAGLTLFTPSLITVVYNYIKSNPKIKKTFEEQNKEFENNLNNYLKLYAKHDLEFEILFINEESIKRFDYVFTAYNQEKHIAPIVLISKDNDYYPESKLRFNADVRILKNFAIKNGIHIQNENDEYNDYIEYRDYYENVWIGEYFEVQLHIENIFKYKKSLRNKMIKRIKASGEFNFITEDLYPSYSFTRSRKA